MEESGRKILYFTQRTDLNYTPNPKAMTKKLLFFAVFMALVCHISFSQAPSGLQDPTTVPGAEARVYKKTGDTELSLHIFQPAVASDSKLRPAIVFFFGGGWNTGSINQFVPHAKHFAGLGLVTIIFTPNGLAT